MEKRTIGLLLVLSLVLNGCFTGLIGREVGRIPMTFPGDYSTEITVDPEKPLRFWTDLNVEYTGDADIVYQIDVLAEGRRIGRVECRAFEVSAKFMSSEFSVNDSHSVKYLGRMEGFIDPHESDALTLKVLVSATGDFKGGSRYDLVIRQ